VAHGHLPYVQRGLNTDGFKPNWQTQFAPMLATAAKAQLGLSLNGSAANTGVAAGGAGTGGGSPAPAPPGAVEDKPKHGGVGSPSENGTAGSAGSRHHALLLQLLAAELGVKVGHAVGS
jgi:hypothetical protein